jgi:lysine-N-methylase
MRPIRPSYSAYTEGFHCIGGACEDTCCRNWSVPVDRVAYEKYQVLPASPLRTLIFASIARNSTEGASEGDRTASSNGTAFAQIRMNGENQCPLLTSDRLCRIHAELGEGMLGYTCGTYPRIVHRIGDVEEAALALSCPEAARLVLLNPELLTAKRDSPPTMPDGCEEGECEPGGRALTGDFKRIRASVLGLVQMRSYPLWQRLFLIGLLCRRLDAIERGELKKSVPEFLGDFEAAVGSGTLRPAMETLPLDRPAQLDVVLRLAGMLLHRSNVSTRFAECTQAFTAGIGNGPGATLESLTKQYTRAHDFWYEPFFRHHPHMLENYLVNTILRCRFPFGREGMEVGAEPRRTQEFAKLVAQFALLRGLLIGVAGFHGAAFSTAHVVSTVQSAAKHFEHHPEFLKLAYELLLESRMDGARGIAILLRNVGPETTTAVQPGVSTSRPFTPGPMVKTID